MLRGRYIRLLGEAPKAWSRKPLRDIGRIQSGGTPARGDAALWGGDIRWLTPGEITGEEHRFTWRTADTITQAGLRGSGAAILPAGSLLVTTRASLGARTVSAVPMATNQGFKNLTPCREVADVGFLYHLFGIMEPELMRRASGTTFLEISGKQFGEIEVALPALEEQRRIAEILDALDSLVQEHEALISKLRYISNGLLDQLFVDLDAPLWSLTDICELISGTTPSRSEGTRFFASTGTPWVKTLDLNEGVLVQTDECVTPAALRLFRTGALPVGTVLVAMYGGWQQIGRTAVLGVEAVVNQAICGLKVKGDILPNYLLRAMQQRRHIWRSVAASTRKDPNITKADVGRFQIPVPSVGEQRKIVDTFQASLDRIDAETAMMNGLVELRKGLAEDLLTGRVRVPEAEAVVGSL